MVTTRRVAKLRTPTVAVPHLPGAACATHPLGPEAWTTDRDPELALAAAHVCATACPVQQQCAVWHASNGQPSGVWAGRWFR